ncbi:MAG TPA: carbon starvation protein A, partial [Gemmatimonadales bacterium]|nr:carbon starvation protein A [Gemmatimonadales bacterium]
YAWATLLPLAWLLVVTLTASWQKIFSPERRIGFLTDAAALQAEIAAGTLDPVRGGRLIFNDHLNAVMASVFVVIVLAVVLSSLREWIRIIRGGTPVTTAETPFVASAYVA